MLVEENLIIKLDFKEGQAIVDLPDVTNLTRNELDKLLKDLNDLLNTTNELHVTSMNLREKIEFTLKNRIINQMLPHGIEVVTMVEGKVQSISRVEIRGDFKYIQAHTHPLDIHELIVQVHQTTVKLYMQRWRNKVMQYYEIVREIFKAIRNIQIFSAVFTMFLGVEGIITQSSTLLISSTLPIFSIIILFLVKNSIK